MTGDFTRNSFRPARQFSAVRMQQGRVLLDADWNEQADIARWFERVTGKDVIGPCGFPEDAPGFGLVPIPRDLAITPGRGYVAGRLIENPAPVPVRLEWVSGVGPSTLYKVTRGPRLRVGQPIAPDDGDLTGSVIVSQVIPDDEGVQEIRLSAGLGPGKVENRTVGAAIRAQPHLDGGPLPEKGDYLAYLEIWERPIGALEDPLLREVALGGPDTCQREQMIWQVKLLSLEGFQPSPPSCKSFGAGWRPEGDVAPGRLAARAEATSAEEDPCALPAAGGYRSLENRLYRVEIHNGGVVNTDKVTWKWSRDNAMHRARLLEVKAGALVVDSPGLDDATAYRSNEWLEVLDEASILAGRPGFLVELGEVNGNRLGVAKLLGPDLAVLVDNGKPDTAKLPGKGQVRRWEGGAPVVVAAGEWSKLENGVEVHFDKGFVRTGDYWTIPARTVTADVQWPEDPSSGLPALQPAAGIARNYCALAIVNHDGKGVWDVIDDCRHLCPPLTRFETFHYLGGDGQEAMPDLTTSNRVALDEPLRVGVARGETPVAERLVRFSVEESSNFAALSAPPGADVVFDTPRVLIVKTNAEGVAAARLALHPSRDVHNVLAELLDSIVPDQADRAHLPIRFTANLSVADEVAYDPASCEFQQDQKLIGGRSRTVQDALDKLCPMPVLRSLGGDGQILCLGEEAPEPLRVGLFWGKTPLAGVSVGFEVVSGDAMVDRKQVKTEADGTAIVRLEGGADPLKDGGAVRVEVKILNLPVAAQPVGLTFHARFANADCVYVNKDVCPPAQEARGRTVAAVLGWLCEQGGRQDPGIHVTNIRLVAAPGGAATLPANAVIEPPELAAGLLFEIDAEAAAAILEGNPIGKVVVDLPAPAVDSSTGSFYQVDADAPLPFLDTYELSGSFGKPDTKMLSWFPGERAKRWLSVEAPGFLADIRGKFGIEHLQARIILHGNRIWSAEDPDIYLDGDLFLDARRPAGVRYPSGDGLRGGDLVLPFRLGTRQQRRLLVVPLNNGSVSRTLTTDGRGNLTTAFAVGINRDRIRRLARNVGLTVATLQPDTARAAAAITATGIGDRQLTVMARKVHEPILDEVAEQFAARNLEIRKRLTGAANADGAFRQSIARGLADVLLVEAEIEAALRRDASIGPRLETAAQV